MAIIFKTSFEVGALLGMHVTIHKSYVFNMHLCNQSGELSSMELKQQPYRSFFCPVSIHKVLQKFCTTNKNVNKTWKIVF